MFIHDLVTCTCAELQSTRCGQIIDDGLLDDSAFLFNQREKEALPFTVYFALYLRKGLILSNFLVKVSDSPMTAMVLL